VDGGSPQDGHIRLCKSGKNGNGDKDGGEVCAKDICTCGDAGGYMMDTGIRGASRTGEIDRLKRDWKRGFSSGRGIR